MKIRNGIDLGAAFEMLKYGYDKAKGFVDKGKNGDVFQKGIGYAEGYGALAGTIEAVLSHFTEDEKDVEQIQTPKLN